MDEEGRYNWINEDLILNINRNESGFCAEKKNVEYERRIQQIEGFFKGTFKFQKNKLRVYWEEISS